MTQIKAGFRAQRGTLIISGNSQNRLIKWDTDEHK